MSLFDDIITLFEQKFPGDLNELSVTTKRLLITTRIKIINLFKECVAEIYIEKAEQQKNKAKNS